MKANEAPENIYIHVRANKELGTTWHGKKITNSDIEYTRTDAFIEKALKWYCLDCECNDNCKDTKCFFYREFERYLEGGTNALPPKISGGILDEDGSTSDDWRYRHFTSKMQDAFIEKAVKWIEEINNHHHIMRYSDSCEPPLSELTEWFKNYMKGE